MKLVRTHFMKKIRVQQTSQLRITFFIDDNKTLKSHFHGILSSPFGMIFGWRQCGRCTVSTLRHVSLHRTLLRRPYTHPIQLTLLRRPYIHPIQLTLLRHPYTHPIQPLALSTPCSLQIEKQLPLPHVFGRHTEPPQKESAYYMCL